jgi:hypothetical protein
MAVGLFDSLAMERHQPGSVTDLCLESPEPSHAYHIRPMVIEEDFLAYVQRIGQCLGTLPECWPGSCREVSQVNGENGQLTHSRRGGRVIERTLNRLTNELSIHPSPGSS